MERYLIRKKNIIITMFIYWITIIVWQYIRPVANRSIIDTLVKMGGFALIILFALQHGKRMIDRTMGVCLTVFFTTQIFTIIFDSGITTIGNLITIIFMFIEIIVFLVMLNNEEIYVLELEKFCKYMLTTGIIMSVYNVIFHANRFFAVFKMGAAYGMECKSFLYSNHEFGIYLATAIISSLWLVLRKKISKITIFISAIFLSINLISTYSRTAIIGCLGAIFILLFFYRKRLFVIWTLLVSAILFYINSNPVLYNIIFNKIMKGSFTEGEVLDEGRSSMYVEEFQHFLDGTFLQKMFGYGYGGKENFGGHDAYLSILLTGGIFMFIAFIAVILLGLYYSFRCIRINQSIGSLLLAYQVFSLLYMIAQTPILFYSSLDCFFLTMITIMIPKYVYNHMLSVKRRTRFESTAN